MRSFELKRMISKTFIRLVSAFRDKLERCRSTIGNKCNLTKDYYYKKFGRGIVINYRTRYLAKFGKESLSEK